VLSQPLFSPQWVGMPGAERREKVWVASHSSTRSAACECAQSGGDQVREWRLKSPVSKVGIVVSKSNDSRVVSTELSSTLL
jgi:acetone carboxylase gamma subunit